MKEKKDKKALWITLAVIVGILVYVVPFVILFVIGFEEGSAKEYKIKDDKIEISKSDLEITDVETKYNEETNDFFIIGYLNNKSDKEYMNIELYYRLYDKEGNVIGDTSTFLESLDKNKTWKFKINYNDIDSSEIGNIEFLKIYYY